MKFRTKKGMIMIDNMMTTINHLLLLVQCDWGGAAAKGQIMFNTPTVAGDGAINARIEKGEVG